MTLVENEIDQELAQFGWKESIATNSISNFKSPILNVVKQTTDKKKADLIEIFICHFVFYLIFCYSLFQYVFIDLGLGLFIVNKSTTFIKLIKKNDPRSFFKGIRH